MPTERLALQANLTWYGKQEPAGYDIRRGTKIDGPSLSPYALVGISGGYQITKNLHIKAGINNLFDKQLHNHGVSYGTQLSQAQSSGAMTYNEHGRSFFVDVRASF